MSHYFGDRGELFPIARERFDIVRTFDELLQAGIILYDGAMGTMLQAAGLRPGVCPESLNLINPGLIEEIHRSYVAAGAQIIQTNTFGANRIKLGEFGLEQQIEEICRKAVDIARSAAAGQALIAVSIGPTGRLSPPLGDTSLDEFKAVFAEQIKICAAAGADLISIETMADLQEARAAVIAAKEVCRLPVIAHLTYQEGSRTLLGTDPVTAAVVFEALGVAACGANCSGGPEQIIEIINQMSKVTNLPLVARPNAGLPRLESGCTVYPASPEDMAAFVPRLLTAGAAIIGGCCGTTPEHIRQMKVAMMGLKPLKRENSARTILASRSRTLVVEKTSSFFIGERINPTGRAHITAALKEEDYPVLVREAREQVRAGARVLDVNVGLPGINEATAMAGVITAIQGVLDAPLVIDSANPQVLEAGLKAYQGKALINSVNGQQETLEKILPLVRHYGAAVLGLTLDENGVPATAEERLAVAEKIVVAAERHGIPRRDILIDCLVLTASAQQELVMVPIKAMALVKKKLGVTTVLGVPNVSYGLPNRSKLDATFLAMALGQGLDIPIFNPFEQVMLETMLAADVISGRDYGARRYLRHFQQDAMSITEENIGHRPRVDPADITQHILQAVLEGDRDDVVVKVSEKLENGVDPRHLLQEALIPAIEAAGKLYEQGIYFLPQLIQAAEAMRAGVDRCKEQMPADRGHSRPTVILATVSGDIHDIGKNIVAILLENYGFRVIDLGKDVSSATVIRVAREERATLIGLSALMTTTMPSMAATVGQIRESGLDIKVIVGGAAVTAEFAGEIGADAYAKDAWNGVYLAGQLTNQDV